MSPARPAPVFHPATLLTAWSGFALSLSFLPLAALAALAIPLAAAAIVLARRRTFGLLKRARWLFLSIALLFAFATPGLLLPGLWGRIGLTHDGLALAAEHVARLLLLLTSLSLLHEMLGTAGLLSGLYWLLAPLRRAWCERIVVRLMLVVEFVEGGAGGGWREWMGGEDAGPASLALSVRKSRWHDALALILVVALVVAVATW